MYSYENYSKVKESIENRRLEAIRLADERCAALHRESEALRQIDRELSGTGLLLFKTACEGGDVGAVRRRNQELIKARGELLVSLGYTADYTEVKYFCPDCSDSGYINGRTMCHCFREALVKATIASSGMGNLIEKQSFDNFSLAPYSYDKAVLERMSYNLEAAKKYAREFREKGGNLLLVGTTGTGKTHISTAIAREVISQGFDVIYDSAQNIIADFETDKFKSGYGPYTPKADKYLECDLLIMDDLGTEFSSQFSTSCIYNLLNTRQNKGLATIISTNLSARELQERYEDRITSRIVGADTRILQFQGKDNRLKR
jgi:DNA replication protein DnaC